MEKPSYTDIAEEFGARVISWANQDGYITNAIIRDALHRLTDFWAFWCNDPRATQNGQIRPIQAFVQNYVECVESLLDGSNYQMWLQWGTTLRLMEIG